MGFLNFLPAKQAYLKAWNLIFSIVKSSKNTEWSNDFINITQIIIIMILVCICKIWECMLSCKRRKKHKSTDRSSSIQVPERISSACNERNATSQGYDVVQIPNRELIARHDAEVDVEAPRERPMILRMQSDADRRHPSGRDGAQTDSKPPTWREDEQGIIDGIAEQKFSYLVRDLEDLVNERKRSHFL